MQPHRLALNEVVEGALVGIEEITRVRPHHAVVGEVGGRHARDHAVLGADLDRKIRVGDVRGPAQSGLGKKSRRLRREGDHRARPTRHLLAAARFQQVDALADRRLLLVERHVGQQLVLCIGVAAEIMARSDDLPDRIGIVLGASRIGEERARDPQAIEHVDDAPYADAAAIGRPRLAGMVDRAGFQVRGLHRIARRLSLRPGLEHHGHRHRDLLAVRPPRAPSPLPLLRSCQLL